jgi:hypothetical protein
MGTVTRKYDFVTTIETSTQPSGASTTVGAFYNVAFSGTTATVDTSLDGIDARFAIIQFCDTSANNFKRLTIDIETPDADTINLTSGVSLSGTYRLLVTEVS